MEIQCTDKKTFELTDGVEKLGHIRYNSLFTHSAVMVVGNSPFEINTSGIFSSNISVTQKDREVARMQMSWKGEIIISLQNSDEFLLKLSGIFKSRFVLESTDQRQLLSLIPDFNWKKFNYNYSVSYEKKPEDLLLVLLAAYSANYYIAAMSGVS